MADTGLRHVQELGDLTPRETAEGDQLLQLDEEISADRQVLGLVRRETRSRKTLALDPVTSVLLFFGIGSGSSAPPWRVERR